MKEMSILAGISSPADLKALDPDDLPVLAGEIRDFLVEKVSATGGHLGPNLGVVELTIALHRIFDSPRDPFVFDTSHQSYVHKILTGRWDQFDTLRQRGGLSGYTSRSESEHDWTESSHASASLSIADGISKAAAHKRVEQNKTIAVVGDGALTGGMCWEALNNIAADKKSNVVIVVNDNGRSYSPTIGGFAENLAELRMQPFYDRVMEQGKSTLNSMGWVGRKTFDVMHAFKEGVKNTVITTEMFPELGMKYVGPVDGHNLKALEHAFEYAKEYEGPLIVHVVTEKGRGYAPAEANTADLMHSTGVIDPKTGDPISKSGPSWTGVFSRTLIEAAEEREDIVAITAAMAGPTGLAAFGEKFPDRFYDVGIAEQHAVASAAGLALGGMHPVVAIYATFMNRAFDQVLMDVALTKLPVTFVLDRSGITGSDGASHNGVWDLSLLSIVPGIRIAAPRDGAQLKELFQEALGISTGPTVVRFPKGNLPEDVVAVEQLADGVDVLRYAEVDAADDTPSVLIIATGSTALDALTACEAISELGCNVTVVDPRWVVPVAPSLVALADDHDIVITIEDGVMHGGIGTLISEALSSASIDTPVRHIAVPEKFLEHASRGQLLEELGMDAPGIVAAATEWIEELTATSEDG
ncbi:1-deoxy-D-xylulose-5-phosphate synthase [Corynebacterium sp. H127]|uniref:1-deoxy-D-xylulose-5-phosphate synthase n=2 Tax=Corynebacterium sp. H127 TaxID=3133418 RepID=UPI0030ACCEC2